MRVKVKIVEEITYSIEDIISQIEDTFGFIYTEISTSSGYVILGEGIKLNIEFNEDERKLDSAVIEFPKSEIDLAESTLNADIYSSGIESALQIVYLIKRMLGDEANENT